MKREYRAILLVLSIVVAAGLVGVGLFLGTGSQLGVYFILAGIPIILIGGAVLYVKGTISREGTSQSEFKSQHATRIGEKFRDVFAEFQHNREKYPDWEPKELSSQFQRIRADLENQGVIIEGEAGSVSLNEISEAKIEELDHLEEEVEKLGPDLERNFNRFVEDEIDSIEMELARLKDAELITDVSMEGVPVEETLDLEELQDVLHSHRLEADTEVENAVKKVEEMAHDSEIQTDVVKQHLNQANDAIAANQYSTAVSDILTARDALSEDLEADFSQKQANIQDILTTVQDSIASEYVTTTTMARIQEIETKLDQIESPLDYTTLEELEHELYATCEDIIEEMANQLDEKLQTLSAADVPSSFFEEPDAATESYVTALEDVQTSDAFKQTWIMAVGELSAGLDQIGPKETVAESYEDIAELIDQKIQRKGTINGNDLPVKEPLPYMDIYTSKNPDVEFNRTEPSLQATEPDETYTMTILAQLEEGGEEREIQLEIDGPLIDEAQTKQTHFAAEFEFGDLRPGEYIIRARTDAEVYETVESRLSVESNIEKTVEMNKIGLRKRLCENEEAVMDLLPSVTDRLEEMFETNDHLNSEMKYPVSNEYIECLLAVWANEKGYDAVEGPQNVVVYDENILNSEIGSVIQYNLSEGEKLSFDDMRKNYLSAPVPDEVIESTVNKSEETVQVDESGIWIGGDN